MASPPRSGEIVAVFSAVPPQFDRSASAAGSAAAYETGVWAAADARRLHALMVHTNAETGGRELYGRVAGLAHCGLLGAVITDFGDDEASVLALLQALREFDIPVVALGAYRCAAAYDRVMHDHSDGARRLTECLLRRGCRQVFNLLWEPHGGYWVHPRQHGYESALEAAGLQVPASLLVPPCPVTSAETFSACAAELAARLGGILPARGQEPRAGILVPSDAFVPPTAAALRLLGYEPGRDVLLAGYDNYWYKGDSRQFDPAIPDATIDKENARQGEALVQLLCDRLDGALPPEPQCRLFPGLLVEPSRDDERAAATGAAAQRG